MVRHSHSQRAAARTDGGCERLAPPDLTKKAILIAAPEQPETVPIARRLAARGVESALRALRWAGNDAVESPYDLVLKDAHA
jgi:hypothetical protein